MLQNKFIILNIILIISLGFAQAQTYSISGTTLDSDTKAPISSVNIFIEQYGIGTTTDIDGNFILSFNQEENDSISFLSLNMIGYKKKIINLHLFNERINLGKLLLTKSSIESASVHIHDYKVHSNQISDISLSGQQLKNSMSGNIALTLSNEPNIGVSSFGSTTSKPVLRGYSGDRFLLTKEGIKTGDLSQSSIDHVITLDMMEVNKIEIIRGPQSLLFGSNTIGGVINTGISGNPKIRVDKFYKEFKLGAVSFNKGIYGTMIVYAPIKNNQLNITISNHKTKDQTSPIGLLQNSYSNAQNYKLGFTKYNKKSYINFIIENYKMEYGIPESAEGHINGVDIDLVKNTFQFNYHRDLLYKSFNQLDIKYNFIDYEHREFENNANYYAVSLANKTHNINIMLKSKNLFFGIESNYKQFSPGGFYWTPKTDEIDLSIYSFYEKAYNNFILLSSFRTGYLSINPQKNNLFVSNIDIEEIRIRNFQYFSSSVGIKKIIHKFEINSWIMNTMRAPRVEELYSDGPHLGSYAYEIGEPNLELEKTYGIESSINYKSNPFNISLTSFYNYSPYYYQMNKMGHCEEAFIIGNSHPCAGADFIEWGSGSSGWLYKYQTTGVESVIKGIEFNLTYHYKSFNMVYDFSLVHGFDLSNDRALSYMNPTKHILNLNYQHQSLDYKIRFSKTHAQNRLGEFESYTPSSFLVDFIIGYQIKNHNFTIQLNNIFNIEYYNHLSRIKSIMPETGRNIVMYYKILF